MEEQVRQLQARLKALEDKLTGDEVTLNLAGSSIKLKSDKSGHVIIQLGSGRHGQLDTQCLDEAGSATS